MYILQQGNYLILYVLLFTTLKVPLLKECFSSELNYFIKILIFDLFHVI